VNKLTQSLIIAGIIAIPGVAMAADSIPAIPTLSDVLGASGVTMTGYFDVAYNNMNSTGQFVYNGVPTGVNSHIFDTPTGATSTTKNNSAFNLQQFSVIIAKQPKEGFGGLVNLTTGQDAIQVASWGEGGGNNNHVFDLTQAYASYATGPLTVIAGKFATLAGAELITSPSNSNYTRAWMFGWGPYTHTGVRATYVASDMVTLIGGLNNGFDTVTSPTNGKTVELGVDITPSSMFSLATTYYQGKGMLNSWPPSVTIGTGTYLDVLGTINVTSKLNFVFDYADATQDGVTLQPSNTVGKAKWNSLALYANYHFNDMWRISYRNENFDDKDGYRSGIAQRLKSNTFTLGYAPVKSVELRGEIRQDKSNVNSFLQVDGTGKSTQMTYALEAIYQF
jgi:hypothetical protein